MNGYRRHYEHFIEDKEFGDRAVPSRGENGRSPRRAQLSAAAPCDAQPGPRYCRSPPGELARHTPQACAFSSEFSIGNSLWSVSFRFFICFRAVARCSFVRFPAHIFISSPRADKCHAHCWIVLLFRHPRCISCAAARLSVSFVCEQFCTVLSQTFAADSRRLNLS